MPAQQHQAAGVIVFRRDATKGRVFLLIQHRDGHWELPKGHIEPGETWQQTALRELHEETGIDDAELIGGFHRQIQYLFRDRKGRLIHKTVCFGLGETKIQTAQLSKEHRDAEFLDTGSALRRLTHAGTRALLRDAELHLGSMKPDLLYRSENVTP